jgi:diguanylate cyclase (GGDEF)-like protein
MRHHSTLGFADGSPDCLERVVSRKGSERSKRVAAWLGVPVVDLAGIPEHILGAVAGRMEAADQAAAKLEPELVEHVHDVVSRLRREAATDPLTGLPNRRAMSKGLTAVLAQPTRGNSPVAVLVVDLDGLKSVNDRGGHAAGDVVLREVAARLQQAVRRGDLVGRWGGDEFVVVCPDTDEEGAGHVAAKLRALIGARPVTLPDGEVSISVSVGSAVAVTLDAAAAIAAADAAMYRAKRRRRSGVGRLEQLEA